MVPGIWAEKNGALGVERLKGQSSLILSESAALDQPPDFSRASGDLRSCARLTVPGFRTARRAACTRSVYPVLMMR